MVWGRRTSRPQDRLRGDEGISRPTPACIEEAARVVCECITVGPACRVAGKLLSLDDCWCRMAAAKLLLESVLQVLYYLLRGVALEEVANVIARRSRSYASFTATMVNRLPGVAGPVRKRLLRVYLRVSAYTHPSSELWRGEWCSSEIEWEAVDAAVYAALLACRARSVEPPSINPHCFPHFAGRYYERRRGRRGG